MAIQPFIRRGRRSNATARRLIAASQQLAPSVLRTTIEDSDIHQPVMRCLMVSTSFIAGVRVLADQHFYLVTSPKFAGRFYILVKTVKGWICSSPDESIKAYCVRKVEAYRAELLAKVVA